LLTTRILRGVGRGVRQAALGGRLAITAASIASTALILNPVVTAQERFGNFMGTVTDPSGAVLSGVTITLTNKDTNRVFTTKTDHLGNYVFRQVEPGHYRFTFEQTGFAKGEIADALIQVGKELKVDISLQVGSTQQSVDVTESAPLIDTTGVTNSHNVGAEEFNSLPKTRSFQSVIALAPSVNSGQVEGGFQVNGASGAENQFFIDGVTTNSLIDGRSRENAAFEFLQEVQVLTGGVDAQYGGATGGVINAVTRSGGNKFHGEAHYYYFGNAVSAGPVKRLFLFDQFGTGNSPLYEQDHKFQDDTHEFGGSIGGPILKDKLFFFSSYSPQIVRRSRGYLFSNGLEPDTFNQNQTNQQLFNKLTWVPVESVRVNANWLWTPTRTEGILPAYNGVGNGVLTSRTSAQPNKTQGWTQPQSNYSAQVDWTITPTSMLTVKGGRFWDNFRTWGVPVNSSVTFQTAPTGIVGLPPDLAAAQPGFAIPPRTQQTFFDIATRSYYQVDFSKFVGSFMGSHDIKIGGGTVKNVNKVNVAYPGGGYVFVYWNGTFTPTGSTLMEKGTYGYYEVDDSGTQGSTGGTMNNLYIQDHWRIHPRVTLTLGFRTENEHVPSFRRDIRDDAFTFGFTDKLSPRVGIAWDVFGNGKLKAYGSYNRLYNWIPYELSRGSFGGDFWTVRYRSLDTLNVLSLSGTNTPGTNFWPYGPFRDRRVPNFDSVAPNLKPFTTDLINAGVEYQLTPTTVVRANFVRNDLVRAIEDMGVLVSGDEVYQYVNPGEGIAKVFHTSGLTPNNFPTPKPIRTYDALELSVSRRLSRGFFGSASYVFSKLYGNYPGVGNSDEIRTPTSGVSFSTSQQSGGNVARGGGSASRAWDLDEILFDSRGHYVTGRLPTDRPHVFKLYGNYTKKWEHFGSTDLGGYFYGGSGTPMSTLVSTKNDINVFVNGRGDMGRTPFLTQTDLVVGQEFAMGETKRLRFEFNATNLFNQKTTRHVYNYLNRGVGVGNDVAAAIDLGQTNLLNGYDYKAMLQNLGPSVSVYDPRFGMADLFNPGFAGRIGVKFIF
jgi:hypothetical protein